MQDHGESVPSGNRPPHSLHVLLWQEKIKGMDGVSFRGSFISLVRANLNQMTQQSSHLLIESSYESSTHNFQYLSRREESGHQHLVQEQEATASAHLGLENPSACWIFLGLYRLHRATTTPPECFLLPFCHSQSPSTFIFKAHLCQGLLWKSHPHRITNNEDVKSKDQISAQTGV